MASSDEQKTKGTDWPGPRMGRRAAKKSSARKAAPKRHKAKAAKARKKK
jgi:hypothetical protein